MAEVKVYSFIGKKRNSYDQNSYMSGQEFCAALVIAEATEDAEIKVSVNSGGGSVTDGYAMIAAMQKSTKPVLGVIDGYAASMGYFFLLGAKRIEAAVNSIIMLHSVQGSAQGSPDDLMAEAEVLKKFNATVATLLAARTGLTEAEVTEKYLGKEVWFTAQEALDLKLIDAIADYSAESIPDVTAGMSYEEATHRFAAMHQKQNEVSFLEKAASFIKSKFGLTEKQTRKAMLSDVEESYLCSILWDVKMAADDADNAMEYASTTEVKALLDKIMKANSAFVIEITNMVYGEEITEPAEVEAKAKEYVAKAATAKGGINTEAAITAAKEFIATALSEKETALAEASQTITALQNENATLKAAPAAAFSKPKDKKDNAPAATGLEDTDEKYLTSADKERIAKKAKETI